MAMQSCLCNKSVTAGMVGPLKTSKNRGTFALLQIQFFSLLLYEWKYNYGNNPI